MKRLTRQEMWDAICNKYPSFKAFKINCRYKQWDSYISRPKILAFIYEFNIHKSRHLTKKQKERLKYEEKLNIINKL